MPHRRTLDTNPIHYVYILFDWCGIPRYVGKGGKTPNRENDHEKLTDPSNWLKNEFIEQTWAMIGEIPKLRIRNGITEAKALETEIALIKAIGRIDLGTGPLTNMTDGGDGITGYRHTAKAIKQMSETAKRIQATRSPAQRSAISKKGSEARDPEDRRRTAIIASRSVTPEQHHKGIQKALITFTREQRGEAVRLRNLNRSHEENVANGLKSSRSRTIEEMRNTAIQRNQNMTREQRSERSRKGALKRKRNGKGHFI